MGMIQVQEHLTYKDRLGDLRLFSLKKAQDDLIYAYTHLMGSSKKTEPDTSQW